MRPRPFLSQRRHFLSQTPLTTAHADPLRSPCVCVCVGGGGSRERGRLEQRRWAGPKTGAGQSRNGEGRGLEAPPLCAKQHQSEEAAAA